MPSPYRNKMTEFSGNGVKAFLVEDLGVGWRDVSCLALGEAAEKPCRGKVLAKSTGVVCGLVYIEPIVRELEKLLRSPSETEIKLHSRDGETFDHGDILTTLTGPIRIVLAAERTILNLLQRLSGIASLTRLYVDAVSGTQCRILDTRKTTPGLRIFEKYAVRTGGGCNHRFGLYDMVMLKDNHITALGGNIKRAIELARERVGMSLKIEVETSTVEQVKEALNGGADVIMLDNMSPEIMKECVSIIAGKVPLEASGGINLETIRDVAETGVDFISVGALTHSATAKDISLKIALL